MTRIAFLGLGAMGSRMAARLLAAGHALTVWNRSAPAAEALRTLGAAVAESPRAAVAGAEVVFAMLFDDAASRSAWLDAEQGAAAGLAPGTLAVETSTLSPAWVATLSAELAQRAVRFVDAPVAGSRPQADAGQVIFLAGGAAADVEALRPLLAALGTAVHHVGTGGAGATLKLAANALFATQVTAVAELLRFVERAGLDAPRALEALRSLPITSPAAAGIAALTLARDFRPQAPVALLAKDLGYVLEAARAAGAALPTTEAVEAQFSRAARAGLGGENLNAVARLLP